MEQNIKFENYLISFLNDYIDNTEKANLEKIFNAINLEEPIEYTIKYKNYDSQITAPIAKYMVDYQNSVYKIVAYLKYGIPRASRLTKKDKEDLKITFSIKSGCTEVVDNVSTIFAKISLAHC